MLKFAVVREDSRLESSLVDRTGTGAALVVASGGCTALSLMSRHPQLSVVAFDRNPAQLAHVRAKAEATRRGEWALLNLGEAREDGLNQRGEFERLFRVLRHFLCQFVAPPEELELFFAMGDGRLPKRWQQSPYWPVAFRLALEPSFLNAMFGPEATQHAPPGSYAPYFQGRFEDALAHPNAADNPFLQHVLLGRYLLPPDYVRVPPPRDPVLIEGDLLAVPELQRFGVVSLSNVFDWSSDELVSAWANRLSERSARGTHVLIRQLNNRRDLTRFFAPAFELDDALGRELLERDRSFFYERVVVAVRR